MTGEGAMGTHFGGDLIAVACHSAPDTWWKRRPRAQCDMPVCIWPRAPGVAEERAKRVGEGSAPPGSGRLIRGEDKSPSHVAQRSRGFSRSTSWTRWSAQPVYRERCLGAGTVVGLCDGDQPSKGSSLA